MHFSLILTKNMLQSRKSAPFGVVRTEIRHLKVCLPSAFSRRFEHSENSLTTV
jgi:hypothetical protein